MDTTFNIGDFIIDTWQAVQELCVNLMNAVSDLPEGSWIALLGGAAIVVMIIASIIRG